MRRRWSSWDTADPEGSSPSTSGFMTRGIESPETYNYRLLITDAVRGIETARSVTAIDATRRARPAEGHIIPVSRPVPNMRDPYHGRGVRH